MDSCDERGITVEGSNLENALTIASEKLGIDRKDIEYRVLESGVRGILGIIKKKKVVIRAWGSDSHTVLDDANVFLAELFKRMNINATITGQETPDSIMFNISGDSEGLIIGRRGQTLDALQYIVNRYIHRTHDNKIRIILDSAGYRKRRESTIRKLAIDLGNKAKRLGKPVEAEPMGSGERRLFHLALKSDREIRTESRGMGEKRKVIIYPKKERQ